MELCDLLSIGRGVTALIGSGGKTTMLQVLARELAARGTVVVCTTTHMYPPALPLETAPSVRELAAQLQASGCVCMGTPCPDGKLTAPTLSIAAVASAADYVLVEADGARGLPVKAHAPHEPVIPPEARHVVLVAGASGFGVPIRSAAHRPEVYCRLAGADAASPVTPENLAAVLAAEQLSETYFLNQCDTEQALTLARATAMLLHGRVLAGALEKGEWTCVS